MPREKAAYRDNLELICTKYPDKAMLTFAEVVTFFGRDRRWVRKWLDAHGITDDSVSIATLARAMS